MRRRLRSAVMKEFQRLMKVAFPGYSLIRIDERARELIFEDSVGNDLSFFIRVFTIDGCEEFDIELAWSETPVWSQRPEFPGHVSMMMPDDPPDAGGACFALHWLKPNPSPGVVGWDFAPAPDLDDFDGWMESPPAVEELLPRVPELVRKAIETLSQLAPPYFERLLAARGASLRWPKR